MAGSPAHAGVVAGATINNELPWVFKKRAANSEGVEAPRSRMFMTASHRNSAAQMLIF